MLPGESAPLVIAVDGPAAVGKGTLARRLAAHYGLRHLDTGLLYRATALRVLRAGGDPEVESEAAAAAGAITDADFDDPALRDQNCRRWGVGGRDPPGRAPGPAPPSARIRSATARRRAGRARHRHGRLPRCTGEILPGGDH